MFQPHDIIFKEKIILLSDVPGDIGAALGLFFSTVFMLMLRNVLDQQPKMLQQMLEAIHESRDAQKANAEASRELANSFEKLIANIRFGIENDKAS